MDGSVLLCICKDYCCEFNYCTTKARVCNKVAVLIPCMAVIIIAKFEQLAIATYVKPFKVTVISAILEGFNRAKQSKVITIISAL